MNINAVRYECLTKEEIEVWSQIQRTEPMLASPYFRPEFTRAVAAVRKDVEIAVLKDGARPLGFLPFQRSRRNVGHPVGGKLSDFHGLIAPGDSNWDPLEILRGCGLSAWHFDHLLSDQRAFSPYVCRQVDSPYIDLSKGLDEYISQRTNGTRIMAEYRHDARKLVREFGPLRFEAHVADRAIVATLLAWKSAHLRQMQVPNILDYSWVRNLLDTILENQSSDFSAVMSVIYAGDAVAAINFGMRTSTVLHLWFQAYNVELARYSPGLLCVVETMK